MATVTSTFTSSYGAFTINRDDATATISVSFGGSTIVSGLKYEVSNTSADYQGAMQCACLLIQAKMSELTANTLNGTLSTQIANTNLQISNTNVLITNTNVLVNNVNTTLTAISNTHIKLEDSVTQLRKRGVDEKIGIVTRGVEIDEATIRRDITTAIKVSRSITD